MSIVIVVIISLKSGALNVLMLCFQHFILNSIKRFILQITMFKVERRVWSEREVHPCRWIKIILNFKFQAQSFKLRLHAYAQIILDPKTKLLCKSLSCLNNIHEWTFMNKLYTWYNVKFKNSKESLESLFWYEVFHEKKWIPFEWEMKNSKYLKWC